MKQGSRSGFLSRGKHFLKRFLKIFLVTLAVILLLGSILHASYFKAKYTQIAPYGTLVDVNDGQMHIYSMGTGEKTIVLLPGMGVGLPSAEFGPLMRKLSEKYTVVCIEYFGVGFSGQTSYERTSQNYVEEVRIALHQSGYSAPYILIPHSISSVYSEYYAAKYPNEVEAIISLDGTSTSYYSEMPDFVKPLLGFAKFQQAVGLTSIIGTVATDKKNLLSHGYTEKEINDMIIFSGFTINDNVLDQISNTAEFIKQTLVLPFPSTIPFFKIIAESTYLTPNSQLKMTPQEYQHQHLARVGPHAEYEILEGNHFIYVNNVDKIAEIVDRVITQN